jgi:hypothetical protein
MQDLLPLHGANFVVGQSEDGNGFSVSGDEFHFVGVSTGIPVDDGPDVAALQAVGFDLVQKNHRV